MKAISLWQPWATLVALGLKGFETRSWPTSYRGRLAIHAAKRPLTADDRELLLDLARYAAVRGLPAPADLPFGAVVAVADLVGCCPITPQFADAQSRVERWSGNWEPGRYAWALENVQRLDPPIAARGAQGLWDTDAVSE